MHEKKIAGRRRALRSRMKMRELGVFRLSVNRTSQHIYAQIISPEGNKTVATASTLEKELKGSGATSNIMAAESVGRLIADRAKAAGVNKVAFDRSGFKYHGRVKALAEAARESGLQF